MVEDEATKALLREADLQHHLSVEDDKAAPGASPGTNAKKPVEKIIAGPAAGAVKANAKGDAKKDEKDKKDPAAKKEDVQLNAAIAHLKAQSAPAATAASNVAVPAAR